MMDCYGHLFQKELSNLLLKLIRNYHFGDVNIFGKTFQRMQKSVLKIFTI